MTWAARLTLKFKIAVNIKEKNPFALKNPAPRAFADNPDDNAVSIVVRIRSPVT